MRVVNLFRRNWWAILYFNFKMLPFRQAVKFPFDFYGAIRFQSLRGKVELNGQVRRGQFQFGRFQYEIFHKEPTVITIDGLWKFNGSVMCMGIGSQIEIHEKAIFEMGEDIVFGARARIFIRKNVVLQNHIGFSWEVQLFDSNFHFMRNIETGMIPYINKSVFIDDHCWIGNRTTINKGTRIPAYSILAGGSMTNKNYAKDGKTHLTLAGCPAKIVAEGYERIFETEEEELCNQLNEREYKENI